MKLNINGVRGDEMMTDSKPEPDTNPKAERAETRKLAERIRKMTGKRRGVEAAHAVRQREVTGMGRGFRLASEFVAAIFVGTGIGWILDSLLNTIPIFFIVFMMTGFAAGVRNVIRTAAEMNAEAPQPDPASLAPVDDEEDD